MRTRVVGTAPTPRNPAPAEMQEFPPPWGGIMQSPPEYEFPPTFQKFINRCDEEAWGRIFSGARRSLAASGRLKLPSDSGLFAELPEQLPE